MRRPSFQAVPPIAVLTLLALLAALPLRDQARAAEWEYLSMQGVHATCIEADPPHERVFVGTIEGFHYLDIPTGIWTERDWEGWIGRQVHAITWHAAHAQRVITGRENAFFKGYIELSEDLGATEEIVYNSNAGAVTDFAFRYAGANEYFACTWPDVTPGEFVRSLDGGLTWTCPGPTPHTAMTAIAVDPTTDAVFLAGDQRVTRSEDWGDTWQLAWDGLPAGLLVHCLAADPGGECPLEDHIFAGNDLGLYETWGEGPWQQVLAQGCRRITMIAWDTEIGPYWTPAVITAGGRVLIGNGWDDETGNLAGLEPVDLAYCYSDRMLYVATATSGVYRAPFGYTDVAEGTVASAVPTAWPNPFRPETRLRFDLDRPGPVTLEVFDPQGRQVTTLVRGWRSEGRHEVLWRPTAVSGGLYYARLRTDAGVGTLRLLRLQ